MKATTKATIVTMNAAGKSVEEIMQATRCSESSVNAVIAEASSQEAPKGKKGRLDALMSSAPTVTEDAGQNADELVNGTATGPTGPELIDTTGLEGTALVIAELKNKLAISEFEKNNKPTRQRAPRGQSVTQDLTKRDVSCLVSHSLKIVYISTRAKNSGLPAERCYNALMRTMKKRVDQPGYAALVAAEDTKYELLVAQVQHGGAEQLAKLEQHNKFLAMGYTVLSTQGRGEEVKAAVIKATNEKAQTEAQEQAGEPA